MSNLTQLSCPKCNCTELLSIEQLTALAPVRYYRDPSGKVIADWPFESSEVDWDSSETVGIQCQACGWHNTSDTFEDALVPEEVEDEDE